MAIVTEDTTTPVDADYFLTLCSDVGPVGNLLGATPVRGDTMAEPVSEPITPVSFVCKNDIKVDV